MAETSYPIVGEPMGAEKWKSVTRGIGDGIIDEGGQPYALTAISNATNSAVVQVDSGKGFAHAILAGFYHKIDAPVTISLPAVTVATTYHVALQYDPLRASMPVKLVVVTSLDRTQGKAYLPLHTVRRAPDQLLTQATISTVSAKISPQIQVDTSASLPPASSVLWGTKAWCWQENTGYRASWGSWVPITGHTVSVLPVNDWSWKTSTFGLDVSPVKGGWSCRLSGALLRTGPSYTYPTTWSIIGTVIPVGYRPRETTTCIALVDSYTVGLRIDTDGSLRIRGLATASEIKQGWGIEFGFSWVTATDVVA